MSFVIDERIQSSCFELGDWPLSRIFLKDNQLYPWFILVPRQPNVSEIYELAHDLQHQLIHEISELSKLIKLFFKLDKLNVGALGNIVPQLHIHLIGRSQHDPLWPHSVWQESLTAKPYSVNQRQELLKHFGRLISQNV